MKFLKTLTLSVACVGVSAATLAMNPGSEAAAAKQAQSARIQLNKKSEAGDSTESSVTTDKNGNVTINVGKGNEVANESGTIDGKKVTNSKKIPGPKNDADEAFWGKGGFWGASGSPP